MEKHTLRILEYEKILTALSRFAAGEKGAQLCIEATPANEKNIVQELLEETLAADSFWTGYGANPMEHYTDCSLTAEKCSVGAKPTNEELLTAANTLRAIRTVKNRLDGAKGSIGRNSEMLIPDKAAEDEIFRCIISEDEIADDATPELRDIRKKIKIANERVRARLQSFITSSQYRNMLQDAIITQRNGRYVVPVKAEYLQAIKGLEHDRSNSGATVFIEPISVLEANNEIKELEVRERQEIERILLYLGSLVGENKDSLIQSIEVMAKLDAAFCRASLAREMKAVMPDITDEDIINIKSARHPLIDSEKVVPIDIICGGDIRALIVTGPNTGGKTVTLKTAGLFALMAQTGLFLPCEKAKMPVFREIYADIGDEQSIEQSLSTFSSHMTNIVEIIKNAAKGALVLLDEIGAGTDPVEGAALALAVLEKLRTSGALSIVTTHYSELKTFAMTNDGYENACMEFDAKTLRPTYRLLIGFAGSSNAFEISKRLGLPQDVIDIARSYINTDAAKLEDILSSAEELRIKAQNEYEKANRQRDEALRQLEWEREQAHQQLEAEKKRSSDLVAKSQRRLDEAKELANEAIEQARAAVRAENAKQREIAIKSARETVKDIEKLKESFKEPYEGIPPKSVEVGESVYITTANTVATVLSKPDDKGDVQLMAGIIKLTANISNLRKTDKKSNTKIPSGKLKRLDRDIPLELDIRGMTVGEAALTVDTHLDAAMIAGLHQTTIIHGKGTGALRMGIRDYLKSHPHVKSQRPGSYGEGDEGVTIVELK